ncbi:hypothetical protein V6N12_025394 [Hibiscus sabdariffa]|uniref:Uncharacterized protein n=1 Tax=Hibiscus sabdariffa TaxID=183260 RepID=A0ABR2CIB7_9ROSI
MLNRQLIVNKIKDFEAGWIGKFDVHEDAVSCLSNKLVDMENGVKLLRELSNRKVSGTSECDPNEIEMSSQRPGLWGPQPQLLGAAFGAGVCSCSGPRHLQGTGSSWT